jgi:sugar lactone lactonase YvrE
MSYFLGSQDDPSNYVLIDPEYDLKDSGSKVESRHRTRDGSEYVYKWGDFDTIEFSLTYLSVAIRTSINTWWADNEDLLFSETPLADIEQAVYADRLASTALQDGSPYGVRFSPDGLNMYIAGLVNESIFQYTLTTAWDVGSASYASKSFDTSTETSSLVGLAFNADGDEMYAISIGDDTIYQYHLSTAWDVSTAAHTGGESLSVTTEQGAPQAIVFNDDGTIFYVVGSVPQGVKQYTSGAPWRVNGSTYSGKSFTASTVQNTDLALSLGGTRLHFLDSTLDTVHQADLTTAWDISTAVESDITFTVTDEESTPLGITLSADGTKLYVCGTVSDAVHQYTLATPKEMRLTNKTKPIDKVNKPYSDLYRGKVKLGTY